MKNLFLFFFLSLPAFAADPFDLTEEEINPETEEILLKKPEKYLRSESIIYDLDTDLGIKDQRQYTGTDKNRMSLAGHISSNYEQLQDIMGIEATYMRRSDRYNRIWYGAQFFQHKANFDAVASNQTAGPGDNVNDDSQFQRPGNAKNTIMAGGLGVGYRFKLLLDFFPTEDWFESVDVFVNYLRLNEDFIDETYTGYGLSTNYGIHKRSSTSFFYGGKISYNVASVTRPAIGDEKKTDRSLTLGWLSLAFEMGSFF